MLLRGIRVEDGRIKLDGYPEGASVRGLAVPKAQELCRLMVFRGDLNRVVEWLGAADAEGRVGAAGEALCAAALVKFCSCFEGTAGLRSKPLKQKNILGSEDRKLLERLRQIRNKMVAHDEHLYPGDYPLLILDSEATAIEAVAFRLHAPFSAMSEVDELRRLAEVALGWVVAEFERVATEIVSDFNANPVDDRCQLRDTTPEFKIEFGQPEDRF